ncbi:bifunctional folylpolyglutamate synthase/dihydrofolate synthase [Qipengyuania qiaonensis]|uniref:Bifunctional folylpolyglutamate synthase/dihydrofolate synthase n=1 Tax=Qipengyuania qiaonensis TaxID=2867240 RepID=A0ABS7J0Z4_9SPHN|nr:folylpolyglutamate synthase/dihydrofolate synthase family protein [Qipengyuania qiaonensis]MBX7480996.1 bifunctional folylpolyglutamate synthase/dihydrofolate synthase [Qipengyuania qiaonensis]
MRDFARSDSPAVQDQLDRLARLSVPDGRLGLDTIRALLGRLGDPHRRLPPVFHVAGTNGKGSTCAFLRAMLEAQGYAVHVTTSPHLVRYNERIRVAGELIGDARLAALLEEVLDVGEDLNPSFFEITIAAAFSEFARVPADACVVEVGLGGRFDATNVLGPEVLAACGIAALGIDHERFLLAPEEGAPPEPLSRIAFEKAGIAKQGVPLVTMAYGEAQHLAIAEQVERAGTVLRDEGRWWHWGHAAGNRIGYRDAKGAILLPQPGLPGVFQYANCALAVAMIRHQDRIDLPLAALKEGAAKATWPARLQRMSPGPLTGEREVWLDGGHNPSAGERIGEHFAGRRLHLVVGMLEAKNPAALTVPLGNGIASLTVVPVPGHDHHGSAAFGKSANAAADVSSALAGLPEDGLPVLISGSLYLAGEVLRLNGELPV